MRISTLLIAGALILCTAGVHAQNLKIGYVDSQKIFEGMPEAQEAQKQLDAKLSVWQDSLDLMGRDFEKRYEAYNSQKGMMTEQGRDEKMQELTQMQQAIAEFRARKFGQTGEAAQLRSKILGPLQNQVLEAIGEMAKEEKLNFVFDKIQDASILLYAEAKFDYTFKVLDKLKRGAK